jgi:hypothetical protein
MHYANTSDADIKKELKQRGWINTKSIKRHNYNYGNYSFRKGHVRLEVSTYLYNNKYSGYVDICMRNDKGGYPYSSFPSGCRDCISAFDYADKQAAKKAPKITKRNKNMPKVIPPPLEFNKIEFTFDQDKKSMHVAGEPFFEFKFVDIVTVDRTTGALESALKPDAEAWLQIHGTFRGKYGDRHRTFITDGKQWQPIKVVYFYQPQRHTKIKITKKTDWHLTKTDQKAIKKLMENIL